MPAPSPARPVADRCPGVLRPHRAADGALVRLRLPGGVLAVGALAELAAASRDFGDGQVQLTSRGNVQLRGVPVDEAGEVPAALVARLSAAGLLPSATHELVRNVVCSPLTGRLGGLADLRPLTGAVDRLLCDTAELADLPGRFLFGLDDGRGDIAEMGADLGAQAVSADAVTITVGGLVGPTVALVDAAGLLVALARNFLRARRTEPGIVWRVRELGDEGHGLLAALPGALPSTVRPQSSTAPRMPSPIDHGIFTQSDGRSLLSLTVPLGVLTADQIAAVGEASAVGSGTLLVTPWHGLVVPDLPPAAAAAAASRLAAAGLSLEPDSPWRVLSACTGAPGCANAVGPTRPVALALARALGPVGLPVHVVACERRCGSPAGDHVEVLLTGSGGAAEFRTQRSSGAAVGAGSDSADLAGLLADLAAVRSVR